MIIYEEFFCRSLSLRVSFNLQGAQRFIDFSRLFVQPFLLGSTDMSASLQTSRKLEKACCPTRITQAENLVKQLFHSRSLVIYHLICNPRSWTNCYIFYFS